MTALAILFCFIIGNHSIVRAADDHIVINEVYPSPDTNCDQTASPNCNKEWIEIYNPTPEVVPLDDYFLMDGSKSKKLLFGDLASGHYYVYLNSSGWLNNSGDILFLLLENEDSIIDQITYGNWENKVLDNNLSFNLLNVFKSAPDSSQSISRIPNGSDSNIDKDDFRLTSLTQNQENVANTEEEDIEEPEQPGIISIADARQKEAGEYVVVIGIVTVLPGNLSTQYFYIQDNSAGIQIYCYKKDFPELALGDLIEVSGEIGDYYTDKRVKINIRSDIKIVGKSELPIVKSVTIDDINDDLIGQIVTLEGEVNSTSGSTFYLEGSGEIKINIRENTNINKPRMSVGDKVRIIGVVSKYKDTYQVLPFEQSGVIILSSGKLPKGGKSAESQKTSLIYYLALWNLLPKVKLRQKRLPLIWPKNLSPRKF